MTKTEAIKRHALKRQQERYDQGLLPKDFGYMVGMIVAYNGYQSNVVRLIRKQSNRVKLYLIKYKEILYKVVYDSNRQLLITFLPLSETDRI